MNKLYRNIILMFIIILLMDSQVYANTSIHAKIIDKEKSVVEIIVRDEHNNRAISGSGFYIGEGLFITNFHLISAGENFEIIDYKGFSYDVEGVVKYNENLDLAIIKASIPLKLNSLSYETIGEIKKGDEIFTIGNPLGFKNTLTKGIISGIREINQKKFIQISSSVTNGSSGGPLFNAEGKVIGIITSGYSNTQISFSLPIDYAINWIDELLKQNYKDIHIINWKDKRQGRKEKLLEKIKPLIERILDNLEDEKINDFINCIHPESPSYSFIRVYLLPYFSMFDFDYQIENIELINNINGEINAKVRYKIFKRNGAKCNNQYIMARYKFRKWKEEWKLFSFEETVLYILSPYENPKFNNNKY